MDNITNGRVDVNRFLQETSINTNIWCRTFQAQLISKHCQNFGIIHKEISAAYSSYVGNMLYNFFDPVAASAELARRGLILLRKISEKWYPDQKDFPLDNLSYVPTVTNWNQEEREKFRSLSVHLGFKFLTSRDMKYRRLAKSEHKTNFIKCKTFSGQLENIAN